MYRRQQPEPLPYQRNFKVRLPKGHLLIATTKLMVTVHHFPSPRAEADYTIHFLASENEEMLSLFHPVDGWDIIGLMRFLWSKIDMLKTLDLRNEELRREYGLSTVSIPSQNRVRQEKRPAEQAMQMICDYVLEHPSCTRLEIARAIGRAKTPYLLSQIEWLVQTGQLARNQTIRTNGVVEFHYVYLGDNSDY